MTFAAFRPPAASDSPVRGLPAGCSTRRAVPGDAQHAASLLRGDDRLEMEALEGRPALEVLESWMSAGSHVLLIRGEAAAIFGIVPCSGVPGSGVAAEYRAAAPWAATVSTLGREDLIDMLWLSRLQIDAWQRRWPVLQTVCDARNRFRSQRLDWLGFECRGRIERFGAAGLPFDLHMRLGDMAGGVQ
jgi:hypothetical protein